MHGLPALHGRICGTCLPSGEPLGAALNSIHNLAFYFETMERVRGELGRG